jgi:2-polyprenyl-6-methoxyphenol hydroxylase-like FAD-dependent oxidoreductase
MQHNSQSNRRQAIVIGASVAGLLAARVLSDFYQHVLVLERDDLSIEGKSRRGVPHGRHAQAQLAGGQRGLESLFPGLSEDLYANGGLSADSLGDGTWFFEGGPLYREASGTRGVLASRPLLESSLRAKVRAIENVEIVGNKSIRQLAATADKRRIVGVFTEDSRIDADLVVDASGRGSKSPAWLESLGYSKPREERVEIQLAYTTRRFRAKHDVLPNDRFLVIAPSPEGKRGGVLALQERDTWIVTLFGHFGHAAPNDVDDFIEYARSLPSPQIYHAIRDAIPVGDAANFNFPASTRRHYQKLAKFPDQYLVFGDAICSFNPIYGQGMSVSALQAQALQHTLHRGDRLLARRFFKRASAVIDNPWNIAVGGDLRMPETVGTRGPAVNAINWYIANLHKQAHTDPEAAIAFTRVSQLLEKPSYLMRPRMIAKVFVGALKRRLGKKELIFKTIEPTRDLTSS